MNTKLMFLIFGLILVTFGCKKEEIVIPDELNTAKTHLSADFDGINQKMASAVVYVISVNGDTTLIRNKLRELAYGTNDITDFAWITPSGIMQMIEPSIYYGSQGIDISAQDHVVKAFQNRLPALSKQFLAVEGFHAAVIIHPVIKNNSVAGGISALFYPEILLENILKPIFQDQAFELWVMEKGGRIIYDQDAGEIGRNLFTDPLYTDFPELLTAGRLIDEGESGKTSYSFYRTGTQETVTKLTYWVTFELYGMQWKLVWVKPE
jgi:hypothetical protein